MRAVIIATGGTPEVQPLDDRQPAPLLPLVDRPLLQHLVEFYTRQGVDSLDFVLHQQPQMIEHHFGDGARWGNHIIYHLARDPVRPYRVLRALDWSGMGEAPVLLGHADRLPLVPLLEIDSFPTWPTLFTCRASKQPDADPRHHWTGWALVLPSHLATVPADADETDLCEHLLRAAGAESPWFEVSRQLGVRSFADVLESHRAVLGKDVSGLLLGCREADPGVWLARNVRLHPSVRFFPPAYVGENCDVGPGVKLGPHATVGKDCVLDARCTLTDAVVFPGSYVGEGLHLAGVLVDRNRLINPRVGGAVEVDDTVLLASMYERHLTMWLSHLLTRVAGWLGLLLAAPFLLGTMLWLKLARSGPLFHEMEVVRLPVKPREGPWESFRLWTFLPAAVGPEPPSLQHFCLRFLPGLLQIARGNLFFVGVPPRSPEAVKGLAHDWQVLYLRSKAGLVTEAALRLPAELTEDDLYTADAFYAVTADWKYDLKMLLRYLARCLFGFLRPRREISDLTGEHAG
jgi:lipopolysaccharide/colanic/teichoic acid biosynthesis glycosyltransferase